jgi:hypothetical protein
MHLCCLQIVTLPLLYILLLASPIGSRLDQSPVPPHFLVGLKLGTADLLSVAFLFSVGMKHSAPIMKHNASFPCHDFTFPIGHYPPPSNG